MLAIHDSTEFRIEYERELISKTYDEDDSDQIRRYRVVRTIYYIDDVEVTPEEFDNKYMRAATGI